MKQVFSDATFEEELKNATVPVLVDFYADWCVTPESKISMSNGSTLLAKEIVNGQKILGLKENQLGVGTVSYSNVSNDLGHCREVTVETGRKIKVTDDHPFFTPKGWVAARELKSGDKVAILPNEQSGNSSPEQIMARLVGFLFTDGTLYYAKKNRYWEVSFSVGQIVDVESIKDDLKTLGFDKVHVRKVTKKQEISGRGFTTHLFKVKCLSKTLFLLLKERGVPVGAKKSQSYLVPTWILQGSSEIKREFLRGFLGGDGPKLLMTLSSREKRQPFNSLTINDLEFHKDPELVNSGLELAEQVAELLGSFGVIVTKVYSEKDTYLRQDGKKSAIVHIVFRNNMQTAFNLISNVGYAYCFQKQEASSFVGEFIRQILYLRSQSQDLYSRVKKLGSEGHGYRYVSRILGIKPLKAYLWLKGKAKATVVKHNLKFNTWIAERMVGSPKGFIWENIVENNPIYLPAVAKITVESTHSYVADGFLSHNCGPCKLIAPIVEQLAAEMEGKIIVGALDVDNNQQTAVKYGVMSIPTLILFKNGQEAKRVVGYQPKENLVKAINEVLAQETK